MYLLNINSSKKIFSEELVAAIQSHDITSAHELIKKSQNVNKILSSFYILSSRQKENRYQLSSAMIYTDAIAELVEKVYHEEPIKILLHALKYYNSLEYDINDISIMRDDKDGLPVAVIVNDLDENIQQKNFPEAARTARNLLAVIDSKQYFNELLLYSASKIFTPDVEVLIITNAVVKVIERLQWIGVKELIVYLLKFLTSDKLYFIKEKNIGSGENINYSDYFLKAAALPGSEGENLLFMSHARQAYRYASAKYNDIWSNLAVNIRKKISENISPATLKINTQKGDFDDLKKAIDAQDLQSSLEIIKYLLNKNTSTDDIITLFGDNILGNNTTTGKIIFLNTTRRISKAMGSPRNLYIFKAFMEYVFQN